MSHCAPPPFHFRAKPHNGTADKAVASPLFPETSCLVAMLFRQIYNDKWASNCDRLRSATLRFALDKESAIRLQ